MRRGVPIAGAVLFGVAGGSIGAANAGWIQTGQDANATFLLLGLGVALVVAGFWGSQFIRQVGRSRVGRVAQVLLAATPLLYLFSWLIQFAIFGTIALALGLWCLGYAVAARGLASPADRLLIGISGVLSILWNTETPSALLLVVVGAIWVALSLRLLPAAEVGAS